MIGLARGEPVPGEQGLHGAQRHRAVHQAPGGHPDRDRHGDPRGGALGGLPDGLVEHPAAQLGGLLAVLGHPQELGGREEHPLGGTPARLCGDRRDPAVLQ